jgi:hypothetical protein
VTAVEPATSALEACNTPALAAATRTVALRSGHLIYGSAGQAGKLTAPCHDFGLGTQGSSEGWERYR